MNGLVPDSQIIICPRAKYLPHEILAIIQERVFNTSRDVQGLNGQAGGEEKWLGRYDLITWGRTLTGTRRRHGEIRGWLQGVINKMSRTTREERSIVGGTVWDRPVQTGWEGSGWFWGCGHPLMGQGVRSWGESRSVSEEMTVRWAHGGVLGSSSTTYSSGTDTKLTTVCSRTSQAPSCSFPRWGKQSG